MAKRCAESLMGHVSFKNLLCEPPLLLPRSRDPLRVKRRALAMQSQSGSWRRLRRRRTSGLDWGEAVSGESRQEEGFCQHNSFLYWRAPLPTIDLSDIQDLDGEAATRAKTSSRTDSTETEMAS
ncbi:uncharacterized protein M6G45_016633 [Spheniscus humboldti]